MEKYDSKAETLLRIKKISQLLTEALAETQDNMGNPESKEELQAWLNQNGLVLIDYKAIQNLAFVDFECMNQKFTATKIYFLEKAIDYKGESIK